MAAIPAQRSATRALRLVPFDPRHAALLASWVRGSEECYWVAPRTPPPLTTVKVLEWEAPGHERLMLVKDSPAEPGRPEPIAYGELNLLSGGRGVFWLGHLVVAPGERGLGVGRELTRRLLERAFVRRAAKRVTLVVMLENVRAIACYRAAGMRDDGYESHEFPVYGRSVELLRMVATPGIL